MVSEVRVVTVDDLDNRTVRVNSQGKVEASSISEEDIRNYIVQNVEEITNVTGLFDAYDNRNDYLFSFEEGETRISIDKVARIKGTNWFVFSSSQLS